jgi:hypothetical protein
MATRKGFFFQQGKGAPGAPEDILPKDILKDVRVETGSGSGLVFAHTHTHTS